MAVSQSVSIRVPQELLEQLDGIAIQNYPARKNGKPNRSRMILDFIQEGMNLLDNSQTRFRKMSRTISDNSLITLDSEIEELIKQQVAQQVQIQLQIQQRVRQQLEQTYSSSVSEIAELRQELTEVKSVLEGRVQQSSSATPDRVRPFASELSNSLSDTAPRSTEPETTPSSVIVEPKQDTALQSEPRLSDKPRLYEVGQGMIPKDFVEPGQDLQLPSGKRIVEISTDDDLLTEIRWCLDNGGDFVFLFERGKSGNGTPHRTYYLRHERYWEGMRPVKTALVRELIDRRAIWTNDPAKGPGSGCRRFYPTSTAVAELEQDTAPQSLSDSSPNFPEWMTAKQVFESLGDDPGDRDSSVSLADGLKQVIPSDEEILQTIRDLDCQLGTDNYLPIFHLREKLQPPLSREELDQALYRLSRDALIELSALQEVRAYTPEQIEAGIPQNIGGRLFFIIVEDTPDSFSLY